MNQIQRCDWLTERKDGAVMPARARQGLPAVSRKKILCLLFPCNISIPEQDCLVKIAGYWPRFFLCVCVFLDLDSYSVH